MLFLSADCQKKAVDHLKAFRIIDEYLYFWLVDQVFGKIKIEFFFRMPQLHMNLCQHSGSLMETFFIWLKYHVFREMLIGFFSRMPQPPLKLCQQWNCFNYDLFHVDRKKSLKNIDWKVEFYSAKRACLKTFVYGSDGPWITTRLKSRSKTHLLVPMCNFRN